MLQKISIQNFKSLKMVTLELQKVNLLIGANNSGKSNFLKALEMIKNTMSVKSINPLFSVSDIYQKSSEKNIAFYMNLTAESDDAIVNEALLTITCNDSTSNNRLRVSPGFKISASYFDQVQHLDLAQKTDSLELDYEDDDDKEQLVKNNYQSFFHDVRIYKPDPNKLQRPFPILPNQYVVSSDGSNIVAFLDILQGRFRENFTAIEDDLAKCIPEFSRIELDPVEIKQEDDLFKIYGDKTFKRLGLYDTKGKKTYWADEISEGVLYFLALLCIVHQPNPPKLLLLEEPEKGIHPRRIKEILDFIFQLAEDKDIQVIMTTHNERVLDEFEDIPEAVFIFDKDEEGATIVKNLLKDVIEPSDKLMENNNVPKIKFTESLGSHWITGFIGGVPR